MPISRVLVVGSGGREHALAWRLSRDPERPEVVVAPGNDGIARTFHCFGVRELDTAGLVSLAADQRADLVIVGPEAPLAAGLSDALSAAGHVVFGASQGAARLESSKWFAKQLMDEADVPAARAERHQDLPAARAALDRFAPPYVVKADGLAAGKGVCVAAGRAEAEAFLGACLERGRFGDSGRAVVIEEFLAGEEASVMAVCDGERFVLLPAARDYKRAHDGDRGPNTGGMGAFAPTPRLDRALEREVGERIVRPVLLAMARRGVPYRGLLYCGLMLGPGGPRVVEFNCRFGDPETEAVVPLLDGSLTRLLAGAARGALEPAAIARRAGAAVSVALVDQGYPDAVRGGGALEGLEALIAGDQVRVFLAGAAWQDGRWRLEGGRAAHVVGQGRELGEARAAAYAAIGRLGGGGWRCRHDIGGAGAEGMSPAATRGLQGEETP